MKKSLFRNLRMQSYLQLLNTAIPLITTPYVARVLGPENTGAYSFALSIVTFFALFALLGTNNYGTRTIAGSKNEEEKLANFWGIYSIQIVSTLLSTFIYIFYCLFFNHSGSLAYCFLIKLFSHLFNIQWYYYGSEEFQSTTMAHMICRIASVVCLFLFVKQSSDVILYAVLMVGFESLPFLLLWGGKFFHIKIPFQKIPFIEIKKHIKPNLILFIPLLAMSVYHIMDKVMIGYFSSDVQGGYYYNIEKIINVPLGLFTGFSTVLLPRMTVMYSANKENAVRFFNKSLSLLMMFGFAVTFGIISVSKEFVPLFLGEEYISCIQLVNVFAPVLIIKCISDAIRTQLLIPGKKESIFIRATILGTVVNLFTNAILIPKLGALGAIIGTIVAETTGLIYQLIQTRKEIRIVKVLIESLIFAAFSVVMFFVVRLASTIDFNSFVGIGTHYHFCLMLKVLFEVLCGAGVYVILALAYSIISKNLIYDFIRSACQKEKASDS